MGRKHCLQYIKSCSIVSNTVSDQLNVLKKLVIGSVKGDMKQNTNAECNFWRKK